MYMSVREVPYVKLLCLVPAREDALSCHRCLEKIDVSSIEAFGVYVSAQEARGKGVS
jgi:hypothetical protein